MLARVVLPRSPQTPATVVLVAALASVLGGCQAAPTSDVAATDSRTSVGAQTSSPRTNAVDVRTKPSDPSEDEATPNEPASQTPPPRQPAPSTTTHRDAPPRRTDNSGPRSRVTRVIDGDTVELRNGRGVRLLGIDTPEEGECGYDAATRHLERLVLGHRVRLVRATENTDRYDRLLRYVLTRHLDAGLRQIQAGQAIARYDSRDGYGPHPREKRYIRADATSRDANRCRAPAPDPTPTQPANNPKPRSVYYENCTAVAAAGAAPIRRADPGYSTDLDADGDGVACEL